MMIVLVLLTFHKVFPESLLVSIVKPVSISTTSSLSPVVVAPVGMIVIIMAMLSRKRVTIYYDAKHVGNRCIPLNLPVAILCLDDSFLSGTMIRDDPGDDAVAADVGVETVAAVAGDGAFEEAVFPSDEEAEASEGVPRLARFPGDRKYVAESVPQAFRSDACRVGAYGEVASFHGSEALPPDWEASVHAQATWHRDFAGEFVVGSPAAAGVYSTWT